MTDNSRKCTICDLPVDLSNMHPNSLPVPTDGAEWSAMHAGCAAGEDAWSGANPSDDDLSDERAWIKEY